MLRQGVAVLALAAACTGCAGGEAERDPSVEWAQRVCQVAAGELDTLGTAPKVDADDLGKTKGIMVEHLAALAESVGTVSRGVADAGPPPAAEAKPAVDAAVANLTEAQRTITGARQRLVAADPADDAAFRDTIGTVGAEVGRLGRLDDPLHDLRTSRHLGTAFAQAPACGAFGQPR